MATYYNENEPYAAQWLKNLIAAGHIPGGAVDARSICDVRASDLSGFEQCHFFAGLGGWALAARLAGWPDDCPIWTGSCPCQPWSGLGKRAGAADKRDLWPVWHNLIRECRPSIVFGEQVAGGDGLEWLAGVRSDLEASGYAVGAVNLPAGGYGAPQRRERIWFVAMGDAEGIGRRKSVGSFGASARGRPEAGQSAWSGEVVLGCDGERRRVKPGTQFLAHGIPDRMADLRAFGNAIVPQVGAAVIRACMDPAP